MGNLFREACKAALAAKKAKKQQERLFIRGDEDPQVFPPCPKDPIPIIFLDFDGVLNSDQTVEEHGTKYHLEAKHILEINRLLELSGAYVVITSSWRKHWTLKENASKLHAAGLVSHRVLGRTPTFGATRGMQIDWWLKHAPFSIQSYVILDDREDMGIHRKRLIQTDPSQGLLADHVDLALDLLGKGC